MSKTDLKPCPFCGGEAELLRTKCTAPYLDELVKEFSVMCRRCATRTASYVGKYDFDRNHILLCTKDGRKEAIDAWNRRANDEENS